MTEVGLDYPTTRGIVIILQKNEHYLRVYQSIARSHFNIFENQKYKIKVPDRLISSNLITVSSNTDKTDSF